MSEQRLEDVLAAVVREHPDATDRTATDGCYCRAERGRPYEDHFAKLQGDAVRGWLAKQASARGGALSAETLREAAREMPDFLPFPATWLNERADEIEGRQA